MLLPLILINVGLALPQEPAAKSTPTLKAEDTSPAAASPAIDAGLEAFRRHRFNQAEIQFRKAVEADPGSAAAHFYLGYTYYKMGEPSLRMNEHKEKARAEFAKAFELDPRFRPSFERKKK